MSACMVGVVLSVLRNNSRREALHDACRVPTPLNYGLGHVVTVIPESYHWPNSSNIAPPTVLRKNPRTHNLDEFIL